MYTTTAMSMKSFTKSYIIFKIFIYIFLFNKKINLNLIKFLFKYSY